MEYLSQIIGRNARMRPDRAAIITESERLTYRDFAVRTAQLAHVLAARGIKRGDRVGLYLPSSPMMAIVFWACQRLGAVPVPISAMFRHAEMRRVVECAGMKALIADTTTWPYFAEIRDDFPALATCLTAGTDDPDGLTALMEAAPGEFEDVVCQPDDIACLFFSSGTTGQPKGIAQTHFGILSTLRDMMVSHRTQFAQDVYLCAVPLFTNFGLNVTLNLCLYSAGTIVLHERWDTQRVLADIARYKATYFGGTPTMYVYIVNEADNTQHDLTSLRICTTGGAPVPQPVVERFEAISGASVTQVYGSTETCGQNVMEPTCGVRKKGSAGLPVGSSRILILDDDDRPLPSGEIGEIIIGGDCVAKGYWNDPDATAEAFTPDGWRSGDLGYMDEDGYLFIVDRKKDVIIAGGHNIYPLEIETLLYRHPAVGMCAVVGAPDAEKGEVPVAVIVLAKSACATDEELNKWCRDQLSAYKVPRRFEFITNMPVEAAKIRKRDLVDALKDGSLNKYRQS
ncbi:class I adenylate-forming enzyme family protein [Thalassorhabdomicrobium marinisediminis]|uniref:class I adenylate-forming enzyme family protein n=1 Tax=Thalassorhabdomicrobium marinisediminis TaxID=2170577 RepID=UPI0024916FCA|nr:AMP-binding protein [Thalassorhabdomicrobium marinisediminis]